MALVTNHAFLKGQQEIPAYKGVLDAKMQCHWLMIFAINGSLLDADIKLRVGWFQANIDIVCLLADVEKSGCS